jgi:pimeloyl-ACP methyl ester carboxylesterase
MWTERRVEAGGLTITARQDGQGEPVVFLQGGGVSPVDERTQAFQDVAAAIDTLGLDRYALCGTSSGGATAAWLAALHGERITALVLVAPPALDEALRPHLEALDVPTMVVVGTRDGRVAPQTGREYKRLIARCDLVYVYDAGHDVAGDRPEAFAGLLTDFLARREGHIVRVESRELAA